MRFLIHPLFWVVALIAVFCATTHFFIALLVATILHESAHLLTAKSFGVFADRIALTPFGCAVNIQTKILTARQRRLVYLAGPIASFILTLFFGVLVWLFPVHFGYFEYLVGANFLVGLINILPVYPLDGGKLLADVIKPKYILIWSNAFFIGFLLFSLFKFNFWFSTFAIVMLMQINFEYRATNFYDKFCYRGNPKIGAFCRCAVLSTTTLFDTYRLVHLKRPTEFVITDMQNRIFYESDLEKWLLEFPATTTILQCSQ